ncbi:natural resistance-associated macrophage protein-domain-containing protein [Fomitopsis serialis]|uniref:natural resistance-associated macrophage protein-domain-containing protein n=1 Tax=Fomitopsis serialis TaxID=139415 RepID=UPI002007466C|nr:natural resistance-associated macrophage protein-domain-containing protein [Neoantrodia serialis]KAH9929794.1 natural resistance-associated macrophage protein-domain-containing protein [Neoantrodia serialis]
MVEETARATSTDSVPTKRSSIEGQSGCLTRANTHLRDTFWLVLKHATKHTGVGMICAVAYFDPGNWGVDLQSGSQFGYKLLFVVLLAGLIAVYMQVLSSKLGCVTGLDLASHCRLLLHSRPKHTLLWRWLVLYPLYALAEVAIVATDLAELLGSAIALCLLFPSLPLYAGVLLTAADVLVLLTFRNPLDGQPVRLFEVLIAALVFIVLVCMAVIISKADVNWGEAFDGFVPSKALVSSEGLYNSIGILGATVMPHSLFLGSAFATQEREKPVPSAPDASLALSKVETKDSVASSLPYAEAPRPWYRRCTLRGAMRCVRRSARGWFTVVRAEPEGMRAAKSHAEWENNTLAFVKMHLNHGIVDMVISLLGLAVVINALILMLASAVFYYGFGQTGQTSPATLFDAYDLLQSTLGKPAATLFALALLAAGQSSSIIATLAGQTVSEGFLHWKVSPVLRRLITRCIGLVPSVAVAAALGRGGVSTLLVVSQVVLSIVLPFIVFPLVYLTSSARVMSVRKPTSARTAVRSRERGGEVEPERAEGRSVEEIDTVAEAEGRREGEVVDAEADEEELVDLSNGRFMTCLGWVIWALVVLANAYAIVTLAMGED